nr:response regulator transcription factor [Deinococcus sp. JMULE3]
MDVLTARVRAHLRRRAQDTPQSLSVADVTLYPTQHRVTRGGADVTLTAQEFRVLQVFMTSPGHVLSKSVLLDRAWGDTFLGDPSTVETYVMTPRLKAGACVWTPPQLGVPRKASRFGFSVRHIRGA